MLIIHPNANLDRIARSTFERSASAHRVYDSHRISLISPEEDLALARSLESRRMIPCNVIKPNHWHLKDEHHWGRRVANKGDRQNRGVLARLEIRAREGRDVDEEEVPRSVSSDTDARIHERNDDAIAALKVP